MISPKQAEISIDEQAMSMEQYRQDTDRMIADSLTTIDEKKQRAMGEVGIILPPTPSQLVMTELIAATTAQHYPETFPHQVSEILKDTVSPPSNRVDIGWSPDYGIGLFPLSRALKRSPADIASEVQATLQEHNTGLFEIIEVTGPYINVKVGDHTVIMGTKGILEQGVDFGRQPRKDDVVIVDFSSPNIAKPFGINHLRSTVIGEALARLLEADGNIVVRDNHIGDWGTQFGNLLAAHDTYMPEVPFTDLSTDDLHALYVRFSQEMKENPALVLKGREYFAELNAKNPELLRQWSRVVERSKEEFARVYNRFNIVFDTTIGEAYFDTDANQIIEHLHKQNAEGLVVEEDGVAYIDGEHPVMLRTKDGYCVYAARDLATITFRTSTYSPDSIIYVVGEEQGSSFKAVFDMAENADLNDKDGKLTELEHISFGLLLDENGKKLSTRKGTSGKLEDVIHELDERCLSEIKKRNTGIDEAEALRNAKTFSLAALIWNDLKSERKKSVKFDMDKMLQLGSGGVVDVLYSYVRSRRVVERCDETGIILNPVTLPNTFTNDIEHTLALRMNELPDVVSQAAAMRAPHILVGYLHELSKLHGAFYEQSRVLGEANAETQQIRLALHMAYKVIIENGLRLLNITPPGKL